MIRLLLIIFTFCFASCSSNLKLEKRTIKETLSLSRPKVKQCYNDLLKVQDAINYSFNAIVYVNDLGFVTKVEVDKKNLDKSFMTCFRTSIFELRFSPPASGKTLSIKQPFRLHPEKK
jgi:hypothetical protein